MTAVTTFSFQQIDFNERIVYISCRLVMFSFTLYCILISCIINKFLLYTKKSLRFSSEKNQYLSPLRIRQTERREAQNNFNLKCLNRDAN